MTRRREPALERARRAKADRNGQTTGNPPAPKERLPNRGDADEAVRIGDTGAEPGRPASPPEFPAPIPLSELQPVNESNLWRLEGYFATDAITLVSALWKSGKSTWLGHLF